MADAPLSAEVSLCAAVPDWAAVSQPGQKVTNFRLFQRSVADSNSTSHSMTLLYITQSGTKYGYLDDK